MPSCAVANCPVTNISLVRYDAFFVNFPTNRQISAQWWKLCRRTDRTEPLYRAVICSLHFNQDAFQRDMMNEIMGFKPKHLLKKNVFPTMNLPSLGSSLSNRLNPPERKPRRTTSCKSSLSNRLNPPERKPRRTTSCKSCLPNTLDSPKRKPKKTLSYKSMADASTDINGCHSSNHVEDSNNFDFVGFSSNITPCSTMEPVENVEVTERISGHLKYMTFSLPNSLNPPKRKPKRTHSYKSRTKKQMDLSDSNDFDSEPIKVGFIGAGNMTQALLVGFIKNELAMPSNTYVSAPSRRNLDNLIALGINTTNSNSEVVKNCDIVFLSVKPHLLSEALLSVEHQYHTRQLFISLAAGVKLSQLECMLYRIDKEPRVIRVVPNTPCLVSEGCCVFSRGKHATEADSHLLKRFLKSVSFCEELPEYQLNAVGGLSGSGPAYIYAAIEALADGGVKMGLPREISLKLAAQTVKGAATMVLETGKHPGVLKDEVCSPGGTTIAAMHSLEKTGLRNSMICAVEASTNRAKEL